MTLPSITAMIPQWGNTDLTVRCVASIRRSSYPGPLGVIVFDNGSPDGPGPIEDDPDVDLMRSETNLGFGAAHAEMAAAADSDLLLLVNNDVVLDPDCIATLVRRFLATSDPGWIVPQYREFDGTVLEMGGFLGPAGEGSQLFRGARPPESFTRRAFPAHYGSAACALVARRTFIDHGGFDEAYRPAYYEDTDLCMRLRQDGLEVLVEPSAICYHHEGSTGGRDTATGIKAYQVKHQAIFARRWRRELQALAPATSSSAIGHALGGAPGGKRILWVSPYLPRPDRSGGEHRMVRMLGTLADAGHAVGMWAENVLGASRYGTMLESMGIRWFGEQRARWQLDPGPSGVPSSLPDVLEVEWDAVVISFPTLAARTIDLVRRSRPGATVIVDDMDLHFLRRERAASLGIDEPGSLTKEEELAIYASSDGVITASDHETAILGEELPGLPALEYAVAAEPPQAREDDAVPPESLLFLGNFQHPPNHDAVEWWIHEIGPMVREKLGRPLPLRVIGSGSTAHAAEWKKEAGDLVDVAGWVADLGDEFRRARVFLVPLRYGAGTKGKITQALQRGTPTVTTRVGAEGFDPEVVDGLIVSDDVEGLADAVISIMTDDDAERRARERASRAAEVAWRNQQAWDAEFVAWIERRIEGRT